MTTITSVTLEVDDATASEQFYSDAFGIDRVGVSETDVAASGFHGFTLSLLVTQPADVSALLDSAIAAGASVLKPATKSMWGFGAVVRSPDGSIWKIATSAKKDSGPATREIDKIVLLLAADDVAATTRFYVERGFIVGKSFGKYVEFATGESPIGFALYTRKALAKDAGVAPEGAGSHRLLITGDAGGFTDPAGFVWA